MKTMKDFAAQRLSQTQMNQVNGGTACRACRKANGVEIAHGDLPGQTTAGAAVRMEIELNRAGCNKEAIRQSAHGSHKRDIERCVSCLPCRA